MDIHGDSSAHLEQQGAGSKRDCVFHHEEVQDEVILKYPAKLGPYASVQWKVLRDIISTWDEHKECMEAVLGHAADFIPPWVSVDFVYGLLHIRNHWVLVAINMNESEILVYDSLPSHTPISRCIEDLKPLSHIIPSLLYAWGLFEAPNNKLRRTPWPIFRPSTDNRQSDGIDCVALCDCLSTLTKEEHIDGIYDKECSFNVKTCVHHDNNKPE
ncbi:uncharacterized protein LOC111013439 [Momordica charantia]|uniref:Uncharacterized protein LOC111013439 n=1 Tax=Momordica charantia TaxID=3673 RepID=A0A6J1CPP7_MOMCH|nr:uncharacterized protein LOC111013439 [Momordica charantia]